ncbi:hypothetical protein BDV93DRAFT_563041 [Ceratobasidium sp. AG-I]|nr:hypothetical protein BDV93DRAFT_563041 [Ceratobasidium sp. AG-I]
MAQAYNQAGATSVRAIDDDQFVTRGAVQVEYSKNGKRVRVTEADGQRHLWTVIPKPPKADKCALKQVMELEMFPERYNGILSKIRRDTQTAIGDRYSHFSWSECPLQSKALVVASALAKDPYHYRFPGNWAALEIMKRTLRRAREDRLRKERTADVRNATAAAAAQAAAQFDAQAAANPPVAEDSEVDEDEDEDEHPALGAGVGWRGASDVPEGDNVPEAQAEDVEETEEEEEEDQPEGNRRHDDSDDDEQPMPRVTGKRKQIPDSDDEDLNVNTHTKSPPPTTRHTSPPSTLHNTSPTSSPRPSTSKGKGKAPAKSTSKPGLPALAREDSWTADALQELQEIQDAPRSAKKSRTQKPIPTLAEVVAPEVEGSAPLAHTNPAVLPRPSTKAAKKKTTTTTPKQPIPPSSTSTATPKATKTTTKNAVPPVVAPVAGPSNQPVPSSSSTSSSRPSAKTRTPQAKPNKATVPTTTTRKAKSELVDNDHTNHAQQQVVYGQRDALSTTPYSAPGFTLGDTPALT